MFPLEFSGVIKLPTPPVPGDSSLPIRAAAFITAVHRTVKTWPRDIPAFKLSWVAGLLLRPVAGRLPTLIPALDAYVATLHR